MRILNSPKSLGPKARRLDSRETDPVFLVKCFKRDTITVKTITESITDCVDPPITR